LESENDNIFIAKPIQFDYTPPQKGFNPQQHFEDRINDLLNQWPLLGPSSNDMDEIFQIKQTTLQFFHALNCAENFPSLFFGTLLQHCDKLCTTLPMQMYDITLLGTSEL
jgi:hypothetical protein